MRGWGRWRRLKKGPGIKGSDAGPRNAPGWLGTQPRAPAQGGKRETFNRLQVMTAPAFSSSLPSLYPVIAELRLPPFAKDHDDVAGKRVTRRICTL